MLCSDYAYFDQAEKERHVGHIGRYLSLIISSWTTSFFFVFLIFLFLEGVVFSFTFFFFLSYFFIYIYIYIYIVFCNRNKQTNRVYQWSKQQTVVTRPFVKCSQADCRWEGKMERRGGDESPSPKTTNYKSWRNYQRNLSPSLSLSFSSLSLSFSSLSLSLSSYLSVSSHPIYRDIYECVYPCVLRE